WTYHYSGTTHLLTDIIDPLGKTVAHTDFDAQSRVIRQLDGLNQKTVDVAYNLNNTRSITDALGQVTMGTYDSRGTLVNMQDAAGQTQKQFDGNFRMSQLTDPNTHTTNLTWSPDGKNLTQVVDAQNHTTQLGYDNLNNLTKTVDTLGRTSLFTYTGTLLKASTDALGNTSLYTYTQGFLSAQSDARGNTTNYAYNAYGQ